VAGAAGSRVVALDAEGVPTTTTTAIKWVVDARSDDWGDADDTRYEVQGSANTSYVWGNPLCTVNTIEGAAVSGGEVSISTATDVTVAWGFSDGGNSQSAYRVQCRQAADDIVITDSGWVASAATTFDLPMIMTHGSRYEIVVQLKNNYGVRST
jgi:hypothetical protein